MTVEERLAALEARVHELERLLGQVEDDEKSD